MLSEVKRFLWIRASRPLWILLPGFLVLAPVMYLTRKLYGNAKGVRR